MLLADNITILKEVFPLTWGSIKEMESSLDENFVKLEATKNGQKTLLINKDDKSTYMHSKYNPFREVDSILEEYKNVQSDSSVIFYGVGLGYHIDAFLEKHPDVNYYIYEPIPEILYAYLSNKEIKKLPSKRLKNIVTTTDKQIMSIFLNEVIDKSIGKIELVTLPMHKQLFPEEYKKFLQSYKEIVKGKMSNIAVESTFQKRWILNSIMNFRVVLSTPNILLEGKERLANKPALLVAAGPSLNNEIENIRYIKENGLAYIFSVGSAINTLLHYNIYPDVVCTYDPRKSNDGVFYKVKMMNIKDIPMIFGTSVGYETLENYPGKKYHMITSQDTISEYYLKTANGEEIEKIFDAPSVAVITLQLLYKLGASKIILVGQNLAFKDRERHASGIAYSKPISDYEIEKGIWVDDVHGNKVLTNDGFNRMRVQLETYIKIFNMSNVINTTIGGASIEGTSFMELKDVISKYLNRKEVEENWLGSLETNYDREYMISQSKKMDIELKKANNLVKEYYSILDSIKTFIENRNFNQAEKLYVKLDRVFNKLEKNQYFLTFILPMNRLEYKTLVDSIDSLNEEKNKTLKGERIINSFRRFMDSCKEDMECISGLYLELSDAIYNYKKNDCNLCSDNIVN